MENGNNKLMINTALPMITKMAVFSQVTEEPTVTMATIL